MRWKKDNCFYKIREREKYASIYTSYFQNGRLAFVLMTSKEGGYNISVTGLLYFCKISTVSKQTETDIPKENNLLLSTTRCAETVNSCHSNQD